MSDTTFEACDVRVSFEPNPHRYEWDVTITAKLGDIAMAKLFTLLDELGAIPFDPTAAVPHLDGTFAVDLKQRNEARR